MDKTININLGGSLFNVEEDAFLILRDYIQSINNRFRNVPGGPETIEDIESRIAEIFNSKKGIAGVITKQTVEEMMKVIGKPEDFDIESSSAEQASTLASGPKRFYRNPHDMVISGVCGGLGAYFNTDPVLFRVLFVIFTFFGLLGLFIYIVLWIAIPKADNDRKLRELFGDKRYMIRKQDGTVTSPYRNDGLNEVANATGKVLFFILRLFLVITGLMFVITGFLFIVALLVVFVFKVPGAFTSDGISFPVSYIPEMLGYIFSPTVAAWINILGTIVIVMPLLALIYWGVRMIFWFKVRDGWFNLAAFIVWVMAVTSLSIILFNEGVSFADRSSSSTRSFLPSKPDTLHIVTGKKLSDIDAADEFYFEDDAYKAFVADKERNMHISVLLRVNPTDENAGEVEIRKHSSARTKREAAERAENLSYNFTAGSDTLVLDEYFSIPAGTKWSADWVSVNLRLPVGTIVHFDRQSAGLLRGESNGFDNFHSYYHDGDEEPHDIAGRLWVVTEDGLEPAEE